MSDKSNSNNKAVRAPLLDAYLKSLPTYPGHMPTWINLSGWVVGLTGTMISTNVFHSEGLGVVISILLGIILVQRLRHHYRGTNEQQLAEEKVFSVVRRLKWAQNDGGLRKHIPPEVLTALEEAVAAHNLGIARVATADPFERSDREAALTQAMHACILAVVPVLRGKDVGRKDWKVVCENRRLINEVVETISEQTLRMRDPLSTDHARLAALRELEMNSSLNIEQGI